MGVAGAPDGGGVLTAAVPATGAPADTETLAEALADGPAALPPAADEQPAAHSSASTVLTRPVERRTSSPDLVVTR
ncbi:hypothetical protein ABT263_34205 [Kitasatospora sp. NPDC001603]|uniref:hypothetical protein n=1 Tax=Kitasatospora sp. NPDC001603 TaxID=3154388 RepID=UPI0033285D1D